VFILLPQAQTLHGLAGMSQRWSQPTWDSGCNSNLFCGQRPNWSQISLGLFPVVVL